MSMKALADRSGSGERIASGADWAHDGGQRRWQLASGAHDARGVRLDEVAEERSFFGEVINDSVGGGVSPHERGGWSGDRMRDVSSGEVIGRCGKSHHSPSTAIVGEESAPPERVR